MLTLNISSPIKITDNELLEIFTSQKIKCQVTTTISSVPDKDGNYQIEINFVESFYKNLWIHCKNIEALEYFHKAKDKFNFFWHQKDTYTLTSKGYIWSYPGSDQSPNKIEVMPEWNLTQSQLKEKEFNNIAGICTDYPLLLRK